MYIIFDLIFETSFSSLVWFYLNLFYGLSYPWNPKIEPVSDLCVALFQQWEGPFNCLQVVGWPSLTAELRGIGKEPNYPASHGANAEQHTPAHGHIMSVTLKQSAWVAEEEKPWFSYY